MADLAKMSKKQLESYARKEHGVELDRRQSKKQLLAIVQELSEDQEVEEEVVVKVSSSTGSKPGRFPTENLRNHLEELSSERRDCSIIWTVIKNDTSYDRDKIISLIKARGYETLLGEIS